jgi:hypothetical protein
MKRSLLQRLLVAIGLVLFGTIGSALAQEKKAAGPNRGKAQAPSPEAQAVVDAAMAERLARLGEQQRDPLLLIAAARVMQQVGSQTVERKPQSQGGQAAATKTPGAGRTPATLLARAKELSGGRADLIALADEAANAGTRGAAGGPKAGRTVVRSRAADVFTITFTAGQVAAVAISGDGDSDLDLEVYDQAGNLICRADGPTDDEICRWTPRWTGPFRVRVVNMGTANEYRLLTN